MSILNPDYIVFHFSVNDHKHLWNTYSLPLYRHLFQECNKILFKIPAPQYNVIFSPFLFQSVNNPYLMGQKLDNVVAKKSVPHYPEEDEDYRTTTATKTTT